MGKGRTADLVAELDDPRLATRGFGLRFADAAMEQRYHDWRIRTGLPFARIGYIGSAPSWAAFLLAVHLLDPAGGQQATLPVATWIASLLVLTRLTYWPRAQRLMLPLAAAANCAAGLLVSWLIYTVVAQATPVPVRAGIMTGGVLIVMYFGFSIFRIPPRLAMAGVTPYLGVALFYLYTDFRAGRLDLTAAGSFAAIQLIAYSGGIFVCVIIEAVTRRSFAKDMIIGWQQQQLTESRDAIQRYMPASVSRRIIEGEMASVESPKRLRVTVLFADIAGFTDIADRVEPEVMTEVLNDYMSTMADLIDAHEGTLNEFAGDGLMALFGAPQVLQPTDQVRRAIEAAQAMQARLPALNESWQRLGLGGEMKIRIGINTGMVSVGSYGSKGRRTYTAIGLQTNIAARIEANAEPGQILLSDASYQLVRDLIPCAYQREIECKGVHYPVRVYAPQRGPVKATTPASHANVVALPGLRPSLDAAAES